MKYYAGIGARATPEDVLERMTKLARILEARGYTLRSGGAEGADKAFEKPIKDRVHRKEIFLASDSLPLWTNVFTDMFHANPKALKEYPRKLMNRNALQILGRDGNTPVDFVVCWTKDGKASGGTGHALRIAKYFDIDVYNLYSEADIDRLKQLIREGKL